MRKKSARKFPHKNSSPRISVIIRRCLTVIGILVIVFSSVNAVRGVTGTQSVLGDTLLLAKDGGGDSGGGGGGEDHGGSSGGGSSGGGGGSQSSGGGSGSSGGGDNHGGGSGGGQSASTDPGSGQVSGGATVDCVGPDGKHFQTSFSACQNLNRSWGRSSFNFNAITPSPSNTIQPVPSKRPEQETEIKTELKGQTSLEVKTADNKSEVKIRTAGSRIETKVENGKLEIKVKQEDGTEQELETKDALEAVNNVLGENEVELASTAANTLSIRQNNVEAESEFPLSVDLQTHQLTVTTPAGTRELHVLPQQAVNAILAARLLNTIQSIPSISASGSAIETEQVKLTSLNNQPVFSVNGNTNKKLLALIPVSIPKTVMVSAETGQVVQTQESVLNRALEALSF